MSFHKAVPLLYHRPTSTEQCSWVPVAARKHFPKALVKQSTSTPKGCVVLTNSVLRTQHFTGHLTGGFSSKRVISHNGTSSKRYFGLVSVVLVD